MKALSVTGIIMSLVGILACIYIMTAAKCNCYCNNDYSFGSNGVPKEAMQGAFAGLVAFIFFMIFSIVGAAKSFATSDRPIATAPPVPYPPLPQSYPAYPQANPYYQQPSPPFPQQYPYQQPQNPPPPVNPADDPMSPWAPKQ
jgi:hypothetical protein